MHHIIATEEDTYTVSVEWKRATIMQGSTVLGRIVHKDPDDPMAGWTAYIQHPVTHETLWERHSSNMYWLAERLLHAYEGDDAITEAFAAYFLTLYRAHFDAVNAHFQKEISQ